MVQIWLRYAQKYPASNLCSLIKAAYRLYIFRIPRFDNRKYFKMDKRISLREIFIEIDHFPIQPFHCCAQSFPPTPRQHFCVLCVASPLKQILTPFYVSKSRNIKNLAPLLVLCHYRKGFDKKQKQKRGSKFVLCRL